MIACPVACFCKFLSCSRAVFGFIALVSVAALAVAITSQLVYGLEPCILCLYQRIPFAITAMLGLLGLTLHRDNIKGAGLLLGLSGAAFLVNAGIAFYHSGVELHWWVSAVEGCAVPPPAPEGGQDWIDRLTSTPSARCSDIEWQDPVLGLTMANYNAMLNFGLCVLCALALASLKRCQLPREGRTQP